MFRTLLGEAIWAMSRCSLPWKANISLGDTLGWPWASTVASQQSMLFRAQARVSGLSIVVQFKSESVGRRGKAHRKKAILRENIRAVHFHINKQIASPPPGPFNGLRALPLIPRTDPIDLQASPQPRKLQSFHVVRPPVHLELHHGPCGPCGCARNHHQNHDRLKQPGSSCAPPARRAGKTVRSHTVF